MIKQVYSNYQQNKDLISVGAYNPGSNPELDLAVRLNPVMKAYLAQDLNQSLSLKESMEGLTMILNEALGRRAEPQGAPEAQ